MQFRLRTLFILIAVFTIPLLLYSLIPHPRSFWLGFDHGRQRAFNQIEVGKPKQSALDLLGEPKFIEANFSHELSYLEKDFPAESLAKCVEFVAWKNGGNWFYCIGVDEQGNIVLKAEGNS